jgi:hypothetical protein
MSNHFSPAQKYTFLAQGSALVLWSEKLIKWNKPDGNNGTVLL